jgi:hypothetical protein
MGFFWRVMTALLAKLPQVAGEPIADLMLSHRDRPVIILDRRVEKPDKAVNDVNLGRRLWDELVRVTGPTLD